MMLTSRIWTFTTPLIFLAREDRTPHPSHFPLCCPQRGPRAGCLGGCDLRDHICRIRKNAEFCGSLFFHEQTFPSTPAWQTKLCISLARSITSPSVKKSLAKQGGLHNYLNLNLPQSHVMGGWGDRCLRNRGSLCPTGKTGEAFWIAYVGLTLLGSAI